MASGKPPGEKFPACGSFTGLPFRRAIFARPVRMLWSARRGSKVRGATGGGARDAPRGLLP